MTVTHTLRGPRTVVVSRNGRTIVATGRGGYVQRPYLVRNGRTYVQRTYVVGGRTYVSVYRSYSYGGVAYYGYAPAFYYHPMFYGWAYNPWPGPIYYGPAAWGWAGAPWYAYYGFTPFAAYTTASLWLTDYLIAANLQAAYAAQMEAANANNAQAYAAGAAAQAQADAAAGGGPPPADASASAQPLPAGGGGQVQLSPEVKQMIADQVKAQLAAEQSSAANPAQPAPAGDQVPDALNPAERIFVVSSSLDVTNSSGQECGLTAGDVVMRMTDSPDGNQNVSASVQTSKQSDCATGQTVAIGVQDLQEMHNQFRQQLDSGLKTLATNSGKGGLPSAPDTGTTSGEVPAPAPDSSAAAQLANAQQDANQTEQQVQQAGSGS
jgi:hypothetical protein